LDPETLVRWAYPVAWLGLLVREGGRVTMPPHLSPSDSPQVKSPLMGVLGQTPELPWVPTAPQGWRLDE
jgi:hypothetical protein